MKTIPLFSAVWALILSALLTTPLPAQIKEGAVVDESTGVLDEIMATPEKGIPASLLANAQGIAIVPNVVKGGLGIGIRFGRGILLVAMKPANGARRRSFRSRAAVSVGKSASRRPT